MLDIMGLLLDSFPPQAQSHIDSFIRNKAYLVAGKARYGSLKDGGGGIQSIEILLQAYRLKCLFNLSLRVPWAIFLGLYSQC